MSAGLFESITKVAIAEIIERHAQPSRFGHLISKEAFQELTDELFELLLTSRNLKGAGDRLLSGAGSPNPKRPRS